MTKKQIASKKVTTKTKKAVPKAKSFAVGSHNGQIFAQVPYTAQDFKNSILIVSLSINMFLLTLWLTAQVSNAYAGAIARFIFY